MVLVESYALDGKRSFLSRSFNGMISRLSESLPTSDIEFDVLLVGSMSDGSTRADEIIQLMQSAQLRIRSIEKMACNNLADLNNCVFNNIVFIFSDKFWSLKSIKKTMIEITALNVYTPITLDYLKFRWLVSITKQKISMDGRAMNKETLFAKLMAEKVELFRESLATPANQRDEFYKAMTHSASITVKVDEKTIEAESQGDIDMIYKEESFKRKKKKNKRNITEEIKQEPKQVEKSREEVKATEYIKGEEKTEKQPYYSKIFISIYSIVVDFLEIYNAQICVALTVIVIVLIIDIIGFGYIKTGTSLIAIVIIALLEHLIDTNYQKEKRN